MKGLRPFHYDMAEDKISERLEPVDLYRIHKKNREIKSKDYLSLTWVTRERYAIKLRDMKRAHVQNTLNWCIKRVNEPVSSKDGILYSQWIAYFFTRLLDPELE